jgi:hypothetical protein
MPTRSRKPRTMWIAYPSRKSGGEKITLPTRRRKLDVTVCFPGPLPFATACASACCTRRGLIAPEGIFYQRTREFGGQKKRTTAAKAGYGDVIYGTGEPVPFQDRVLTHALTLSLVETDALARFKGYDAVVVTWTAAKAASDPGEEADDRGCSGFLCRKNISKKEYPHRDLSTALRFGRDDKGECGASRESSC